MNVLLRSLPYASSPLHIVTKAIRQIKQDSCLGLTFTNPIPHRRDILHNQRPDEMRRGILPSGGEAGSRIGPVNNIPVVHHIRLKTLEYLGAPAPFLEAPRGAETLVRRRKVAPAGLVALLPRLVQGVKDGQLLLARRGDQGPQVGVCARGLEGFFPGRVYFALVVEEVVVGVDEDDCCVGRGHGVGVLFGSVGKLDLDY
ncbi:hypothetical protein CSAL01_06439 [Colletotrichum salicis]|uniref:Uncharacterized protein n=1 Tax=Colletotrichum salicis TaxID=1209931 RepID=A0A135U0B3_9PEZI|nr:hypothetical protein CSAL01_06439 [Colletotrichum salicis]